MKPSRFNARMMFVCAVLLTSASAEAFYNPSTGRWLSRDPAGESGGINAQAFVGNRPPGRWDYLGLFSTSDHVQLTALSFIRARVTLPITCIQKVLGNITEYNKDQDTYYLWSNKRHYNRSYVQDESDYWRDYNRWMAVVDYQRYLEDEERDFNYWLRDHLFVKHDCKKALRALGHLSHSWQDFYAHGIHAQGGWESGGWLLDTPDWVFDFVPSSYGSLHAEHPLFWEPQFSAAEYSLRKSSAEQYVQWRFESFLSTWAAVCNCECDRL